MKKKVALTSYRTRCSLVDDPIVIFSSAQRFLLQHAFWVATTPCTDRDPSLSTLLYLPAILFDTATLSLPWQRNFKKLQTLTHKKSNAVMYFSQRLLSQKFWLVKKCEKFRYFYWLFWSQKKRCSSHSYAFASCDCPIFSHRKKKELPRLSPALRWVWYDHQAPNSMKRDKNFSSE